LDWIYEQPVKIIFRTGGAGNIESLLKTEGWRRAVLICDPFFANNGLTKKIYESSGGRIVQVFSDVNQNPRVEDVNKCADIMRNCNADCAIALGGGSSIDCAKAACAIALTNDRIEQYHTGGKALTDNVLPLMAIPTTAGTGSEVTCVSVLTDPAKGIKSPIADSKLYAKVALIDPELTYSVPRQVTASTGFDAISHALEGFWSKNHQPICDALAVYAAKLGFKYLEAAYNDGNDIIAREKMCEASLIAGLAFTLPKTAAAHACSFPLTNIYSIPHGEACAFTLDLLCEINAEAEGGRLNDFAREIGFENAVAMAKKIREMKKAMGMKFTLKDAGIKKEELDSLAEKCKHPNILNNPVYMGTEEIKKMFLKLA